MHKNKLLSVTIGISALNEGKNICNLLRSIMSQEEHGYSLKKIIVISDGSTDNTVNEIEDLNDERIHLIKGDKRLGKSYRLNQLFKMSKSDIIVLFDADVVLSSSNELEKLVAVYETNTNVGMVCGRAIPMKGTTFLENSVNASHEAYDRFRSAYKNGENPYSVEGRILSLSKNFYKSVQIPQNIFTDDVFLYFSCITLGYNYKHAKNATVLYHSPKTLSDQVRQNSRFEARKTELRLLFGKLVDQEFKAPKIIFYRELLLTFINKPFYSASIFFINLYCKYKAFKKFKEITSLWKQVATTKGAY